MKKKLSRIWGIGFVIVLAASLLLSAAPVSGSTLSWGSEDLPDEFVDNVGDDIVDMAVSGDGSIIYVTVSSNETYRSSNGGESWTTATVIDGTDVMADVDFIAVAQDDPNYLAVANTTGNLIHVFISDDAGANWDTLGAVGALDTATDLAISVEKGGNHFIAVIGDDGGTVETWYYEIGAIGSAWTEATGGSPATADAAGAVAFSPNFYSDQVMVNITANVSGDTLDLNIYSFNTNTWNSGAFTAYPADLMQDTPGTLATLDSASIAMAPDYLGSDDDMRVLFYGLTVNAGNNTETDGIFRLDDDDVTTLKDEKEINSVAFDGSLLVAGRYDNAGVYRSTDPLADDPSVSGSTSTKNPGSSAATPLVLVGIAGSDVVAGTTGDESAFAYSEDNGKTFNDLSLIDTRLTTLSDVAVTPDGSMVYLVTCNGTVSMSVWLLDGRWERIYSNDAADDDYIIRIAPDDSDVIYLADVDGTSVYFSSTGGADKWHTRIYKETTGVVDLTVEADGDTVYILTTLGYVSKSSNRGFTWDSKKSSKLSGGSSMITSLGEDLVLAGSSDGRVSYSTDGNANWTKIGDEDFDETGLVQVTATGLADGDFIIAASNHEIYSWELGEADDWDNISPDAFVSGNVTTGIGIFNGVLYAIADGGSGGTDSILARTLTPTSDDPTWSTKVLGTATFTAAPTALRISAGSDITLLWAIDTASDALYSYKDTLAMDPVGARSPADGADIPFNTVSGESEQIVFSWTSPSDKVTEFDFEIATDTDFDETVIAQAVVKSSGTWDEGDVISQIIGPGASGNFDVRFMPDQTYYWKVRVDAAGPVRSAWSETRSFSTGSLPEVLPPVIIQQPPAPVIQVPPAPSITITPPEIVLPAPLPAPPAPEIIIPAAPAPTPPVPSWAIYAIIIIGAVLVLALIILIMRTRRPV